MKKLLMLTICAALLTASCSRNKEPVSPVENVEQTENAKELHVRFQFVGNGKWIPIYYWR